MGKYNFLVQIIDPILFLIQHIKHIH